MADNGTLKNLKHELFCKLYATEREFFGNGTQAYIEAFDIDTSKKGAYAAARASASGLLTKANILARINELLELGPLNNEFVDRQIGFLIEQNADYSAKMAAIKEYNALKKRIVKKIEATVDGELSATLVRFIDEPDNKAD